MQVKDKLRLRNKRRTFITTTRSQTRPLKHSGRQRIKKLLRQFKIGWTLSRPWVATMKFQKPHSTNLRSLHSGTSMISWKTKLINGIGNERKLPSIIFFNQFYIFLINELEKLNIKAINTQLQKKWFLIKLWNFNKKKYLTR